MNKISIVDDGVVLFLRIFGFDHQSRMKSTVMANSAAKVKTPCVILFYHCRRRRRPLSYQLTKKQAV